MSDAQEHHLTVSRSARYYQLGELSAATRRVWFVAHGYGQLATYFIRHFALLTQADPTLVVVAPEGLSKFYLTGNSGRIGASWMTREDRLTEIEDYVSYLNQLAESTLALCSPDVEITVLGFSQGGATVSRWLSRAQFRPTRLILWAGRFPPDMEFEVATHLLNQLPLTVVCGDEDPYVSAEAFEEQLQLLRSFGVEPEVIRFAGKHELNASVLQQLASR